LACCQGRGDSLAGLQHQLSTALLLLAQLHISEDHCFAPHRQPNPVNAAQGHHCWGSCSGVSRRRLKLVVFIVSSSSVSSRVVPELIYALYIFVFM